MRVWPLLLLLAACDRKNPHADYKPAETWDEGAEAAQGTGPVVPPQGSASPHGSELPPDHPPIEGGGGMDPQAMAPDPNRKVDASQFLRGTISLAKGAAVPAGGVLFLAVRQAGPDGKPLAGSMPLAVDIAESPTFPHDFELTAHKQMVDGTTFQGEVLVVARIDQDSNADTKQPGDLYGQVKATIPADKLAVTLEPL